MATLVASPSINGASGNRGPNPYAASPVRNRGRALRAASMRSTPAVIALAGEDVIIPPGNAFSGTSLTAVLGACASRGPNMYATATRKAYV